MGLIGGLLASWYTGRAFYKFTGKEYKNAVCLFEKALRLDPKSGRTELTYSCLGRCYLALGQMDRALQNFSVAYESYQKNISSVQGKFETAQYKEFLKTYSYALSKVGQLDQSKEIARKAEEFTNAGSKN